ncbi:metal ABC transporter solute-binding protein, Zn/Mn family [Haloechinothrix sp. LS1_15]|uniref:metal ABC transporter solute-binding protein, Zn/Mn family n=1 Tax=Haloechinothrix sp. LS1_15 TaxID=2652248 RepID=UPI00294B2235|nr:zinc ABC transporter substrate-binding protein [Haloechinothrix sp. LS1_15]
MSEQGSELSHQRGKRRKRRALLAGGAVATVAALAGGLITYALASERAPGQDRDRLSVVTTTNFLDDTVRQIGGDDIETVRLMGPGVDPHLYQARSSDLEAMRSADAIVAVGLFLEGSLQQTFDELSSDKPVIFAGEQLDEDVLLAPEADAPEGTEFDPHIWLDPRLWAEVVTAVGDELGELDPERAGDYTERAAEYRQDVLALHEEITATLATVPDAHRTLVTSHDAFRYFGRAYDIDVAAIQGISTEEEATTSDVSRVADIVVDTGVPAVFMESSVPSNTLDAVIAAAGQQGHDVRIGAELYGDAAGDDGTKEGTYIGMLRANAERIADGLTGNGG